MAELARWLGEGLALVADVFDPELVVIGGGVSGSAPLFLDEAREHYAATVTGAGNRPLARIRTAQLGEAAAVVGVAQLARQEARRPRRRAPEKEDRPRRARGRGDERERVLRSRGSRQVHLARRRPTVRGRRRRRDRRRGPRSDRIRPQAQHEPAEACGEGDETEREAVHVAHAEPRRCDHEQEAEPEQHRADDGGRADARQGWRLRRDVVLVRPGRPRTRRCPGGAEPGPRMLSGSVGASGTGGGGRLGLHDRVRAGGGFRPGHWGTRPSDFQSATMASNSSRTGSRPSHGRPRGSNHRSRGSSLRCRCARRCSVAVAPPS